MNDRRNSDPISDSTSFNAPSRKVSTSSQGSSSGRRYKDSGSSRSSARQSTYEDLAKSLKQQLLAANRRLKELRAADTEQQILALLNQLEIVNDARITAVQEAAKATEELELYKIQLQNAHQEIRRAQEIINKVDQERYDAEKAASEARTMARRYQRELLMMKAMEEGRKLGMQEGIERSRTMTLREAGEYEEGYAREYLDYSDAEVRNEEIVVQPSQPLDTESAPQPPFQPIPMPAPESVHPISVPPSESIQPVSGPPPESVLPITVPPPESVRPIPVPPPELIQPIPATRPRSFRSPSPSVRHPSVSIPPDGYIPTIDPDNVIRMPPPHELARPPPTPERPPSTQLPDASHEESRPSSRSHRRNRSSSSVASASTNAAGPLGRAAPLSAILEVQTPHTSPVPQSVDGHTLRHQLSQISSHRSSSVNPERGATGPLPVPSPNIHRPSSVNSNILRSLRPSSLAQEDDRKSSTSFNVPAITVTDVPRSSMMSQLFGDRVIGQPGPSSTRAAESSPHRTPEALPIPMPGAYRDLTDQMSTRENPRSGSSNGHRVIDDDTTSIRSRDTLTTSRTRRRSHHPRASVDSLTTPPPENSSLTGWEDAARVAGSSVPVPHDNRTSWPVSRNTDRSNR